MADLPSCTHRVPRSLVKSGGGEESHPFFRLSDKTSSLVTESGISIGIARRDLLIVMSLLVK